MFASVSLPISRPQSSFFVPKTAVVSTAERTYVIRIAQGRTELVDVQVGDENSGQVQVFGKLKADEVACEGERADQIAGYLRKQDNRRTQRLNVLSIGIGAASGIGTKVRVNVI